MMVRAAAFALGATVAFLASGPANAFDLAGFKKVAFGATPEALTALGYACADSGGRMECKGDDTLFGLPAGVRVWFADGKVNAIRVMPMDGKPIDLVAAFTKALGKPWQYTDAAWRDGNITVYYWLAKDGTSVSTFVDKKGSSLRDSEGRDQAFYANADYLDRAATVGLLDKAKKAQAQKTDY